MNNNTVPGGGANGADQQIQESPNFNLQYKTRRGNPDQEEGLNMQDLDDAKFDARDRSQAQRFAQENQRDISNSQIVDNFTSQMDDKKYKMKSYGGAEEVKKNANKIRVLFLGDEGVGKTSIIVTLISDNFPRVVHKTYHPVTISPDHYLLPNKVYTQLIDTSTMKYDEQNVDSQIEKANVIMLVYDVNNFDCIKRLKTYWMPRISKIDDKVPVIYVGNKVDLVRKEDENEHRNLLNHHFEQFQQLQMGIRCSAKVYINLIDVIAAAQKTVLFPTTPLYDAIERQLKPDYVKALLRIFRICDKDADGIMDDQDLYDLQKEVFNQELRKEHITALKQIVAGDNIDRVTEIKGIDFEAFKQFMKKYIITMKGQTCWKILKHFGYDSHLQIRRQIWDDKSISEQVLKTARSFEITPICILYLQKLFNAYKIDSVTNKSTILDTVGIEKIFATCQTNDGMPFDAKRETRYLGGVTYQLWIGLWQKAFCENPLRAFKFLVYTGFVGGQMKDVVNPIHIKTRDIIGLGIQHRRFVFNCFVIGYSNSGKSTFLDAIVQTQDFHNHSLPIDGQTLQQQDEHDRLQRMQSNYMSTSRFRSVINAYHPSMDGPSQRQLRSAMAASPAAKAGNLSDGLLKYIIYTEIPDDNIGEIFDDQEIMSKCDCIALFYEDEREHKEFLKEIYQKLPQLVPKVLIQTKMDLIQSQNQQAQMELAKELGGQKLYKQISVHDKNFSDATDAIIQIALDPKKGLTDECLEIAKAEGGGIERWLGISPQSLVFGVVVVASAAAASFQLYKKHQIKI